MPVNKRREFLRQSAMTMAGLAVVRELAPQTTVAAVPAPTTGWPDVKAQFDLDRRRLPFASFFLVSHPRSVRLAIERYRLMLDADPYGAVEKHCFGPPEDNLSLRVKRVAAAYLGGEPGDVTLTQSTTMGLALLYNGLTLSKGQEILITEHDHYVQQEAARYAAVRSGASVKTIRLFDRFEDLRSISEASLVNRIRTAITPATRVIGITWVHSESGLKLPLRAIADAVARANAPRAERDRALLFVDAVHGFGVEDESLATTGVDAVAAGTHKWLLAPRGTGIIWAKPQVWARLRPSIPTFDDLDLYADWLASRVPAGPPRASWFTPGGFHAFEHEWAMVDGFAFHTSIGRARVAARIHALNAQLKEGLATMPGVTLITPRSEALSAGLVGFDIAGQTAEESAARLLAKDVIASASPYRRQVVRLSASLVNDEAEVERALAAVRTVAAQ